LATGFIKIKTNNKKTKKYGKYTLYNRGDPGDLLGNRFSGIQRWWSDPHSFSDRCDSGIDKTNTGKTAGINCAGPDILNYQKVFKYLRIFW